MLKDKKPVNCGIVGHRKGHDFSNEFFSITRGVRYGESHDSFFITEQGAINMWVYSLQLKGINHHILDFKKNAWIRDFVYFLEKGVSVETVHAVTWHKKVIKELNIIFENKVLDNDYSNIDFLGDILSSAESLNEFSKHLIRRQLGIKNYDDMEFLLPYGSF